MTRTSTLVCALSLAGLVGCPNIRQATESVAPNKTPPLYTAMSQRDVLHANGTIQVVLETRPRGLTESWRNPLNGHTGTVTATDTYRTKSGIYCRIYNETLTIGERTEEYTDTACRDRNGQWRPR